MNARTGSVMKPNSEFAATPDGGLEPDRVLKGGWYTLWIMMLLILVANVDRQVLVLAAQPISLTLGLSDGELGMIQGLAVGIFAILAVYPIAWAADRFDRRLVFGICVLTWSLGTAACGLAQNFDQLLGSAILMAAGEAGLTPIGVAFVPALFKGRKRQLANSVSYFFIYMGIAAGLVLSGGAIALIDQVHGDLPASLQSFEAWRLAFFLVALPTPIFLILLAFTKLHYRSDAPETVRKEAPRHNLLPFVKLHRRAVVAVFMGTGLYTLGIGSYMVWLPVAATRMFGTTPGQNGTLMGIATAIGLTAGVSIGTFFVRRMMVSLGSVASIRFFGIALLAAIPIFVAFPFVTASWQLFGLYGLLMVAYTAAGCAMPTIVQDMAPADLRGRMSAVWTIVNVLLGGLSPALIGWLSTSLGPEPRMLIFAMGLIAIPAWIASAVVFRMAEKPFAELARASNADLAAPETHAV
jgi:MFS family permease